MFRQALQIASPRTLLSTGAAVSQGLAQTRIRDALLCAVDVHEAREANEKREAEGLDVAEQRLSELMRAVNREKNMRLGSSARRTWI